MEIIRNYNESDWEQVSKIYDLSKPDEMGGLVNSALITPLAQDDKMLRYFNESIIWVYEDEHKIFGFIGLKENVIVGKKIPAGTGIRKFDSLFVTSTESHNAYRDRKALMEEYEDYDEQY